MPKVYCDSANCKFCNTNDECECEVVYLCGDSCGSYVDYAEQSPEYQEKYYAHILEHEGKKEVHLKRLKYGKKYELLGYTFYTSNDDRRGIDNCFFTEETSGVGIYGAALLNGTNMEERMRKALSQVSPVSSLQDYDEWDSKRLKQSIKAWQKG